MPRVLVEIAVEPAALPTGRKFLHRRVTLKGPAGVLPKSVSVPGTTASFADVASGVYTVTVQDIAEDSTLLGTAIFGELAVGDTPPPPGGMYSASAGLSFQVAA